LNASLLTQTIISGFLVSAVIVGLLWCFAPRRARWPQIAAGVILLDHGSKWLVAEIVKGGGTHSYLAGNIQIGYYTNYLQGFGATSPWLLCATLVGVIGAIRLYQMLVERHYRMSFATEAGLALVLGAVAAIALERAWTGYVVDFLQLGATCDYVCNMADLAALAGLAILSVRGLSILPAAIEQELAAAAAGEGVE
jgi:lipoprotein signal peptidase